MEKKIVKEEIVEGQDQTFHLEKKWFAVRTFSGHEKKVKEYLDKEIEKLNLSDKIVQVYIPYERFVEIKNGKKKSKVKNAFPGYVLVEMCLDNQTKNLVLEAPSVMNFLGESGGKLPIPLRQDEVKRIFDSQNDSKQVSIESSYEVGISVRIINGAFASLTGVVQEVHNEKMKLKVLINFFGRSTPVEVDFLDVKRVVE